MWRANTSGSQPTSSARFAEEVDGERPRDASAVERRTPRGRVDAIQRERIVHRRTQQLREAGEPGADGPAEIEAGSVPAVARDIGGRQRAGPDRAHVAAQDVDELRK